MNADSGYLIIKRKASYIVGVWDDVHTEKSLILPETFRTCSLHNGRPVQMGIVVPGASVFDCYVQRVFIQMGLLKLIEVNKVFNV